MLKVIQFDQQDGKSKTRCKNIRRKETCKSTRQPGWRQQLSEKVGVGVRYCAAAGSIDEMHRFEAVNVSVALS